MQKPNEILSSRVPKHFYIPSRQSFITAGEYVKIWRFCISNPGMAVKQTIQGWWQGTTDEILKQIRDGLHERIYLRQFIKN